MQKRVALKATRNKKSIKLQLAQLKHNFAYKCTMLFVYAVVLSLTACADKTAQMLDQEGPDTLYNQALANFNAKRFTEAGKKFAAVERQFPYSDWARKSLIMGAYTSYLNRNYSDVTTTAKRFIELYPKSPDVPYAYYLTGLAYFEQIPDITRDQSLAIDAIVTFKQLIDRFPRSRFVPAALVKIRYAREHLAGKEMQIGRYYQERRQYLAALQRYQTVIEKYSDTNQVEEALYRLVEINLSLGLVLEAKASASLLGQNFPQSPWYHYAYNLLVKR